MAILWSLLLLPYTLTILKNNRVYGYLQPAHPLKRKFSSLIYTDSTTFDTTSAQDSIAAFTASESLIAEQREIASLSKGPEQSLIPKSPSGNYFFGARLPRGNSVSTTPQSVITNSTEKITLESRDATEHSAGEALDFSRNIAKRTSGPRKINYSFGARLKLRTSEIQREAAAEILMETQKDRPTTGVKSRLSEDRSSHSKTNYYFGARSKGASPSLATTDIHALNSILQESNPKTTSTSSTTHDKSSENVLDSMVDEFIQSEVTEMLPNALSGTNALNFRNDCEDDYGNSEYPPPQSYLFLFSEMSRNSVDAVVSNEVKDPTTSEPDISAVKSPIEANYSFGVGLKSPTKSENTTDALNANEQSFEPSGYLSAYQEASLEMTDEVGVENSQPKDGNDFVDKALPLEFSYQLDVIQEALLNALDDINGDNQGLPSKSVNKYSNRNDKEPFRLHSDFYNETSTEGVLEIIEANLSSEDWKTDFQAGTFANDAISMGIVSFDTPQSLEHSNVIATTSPQPQQDSMRSFGNDNGYSNESEDRNGDRFNENTGESENHFEYVIKQPENLDSIDDGTMPVSSHNQFCEDTSTSSIENLEDFQASNKSTDGYSLTMNDNEIQNSLVNLRSTRSSLWYASIALRR